ncbi:MAG: histidine phosphatase family protein [Acidimicrobiales bacterium]|nr:histidine phosphatase family protein [Acidimicrobiales bacterium]
MTLYVVRHAAAGDRFRWSGDDFERPLDDRGVLQAEALAAHLADAGISRLLSSQATRCVQTLTPLGERLGIDVELCPAFTEGSDVELAAATLRRYADMTVAACSHGDIIPELIRALMMDGMRVVGARGCEKGSIWKLDVNGGDIVQGQYLGVPTAVV